MIRAFVNGPQSITLNRPLVMCGGVGVWEGKSVLPSPSHTPILPHTHTLPLPYDIGLNSTDKRSSLFKRSLSPFPPLALSPKAP